MHRQITFRTLLIIAALISPGLLAQKRTASELLHQAALRGQTASIEMLLKLGADPNVRDKHGRTALHDACLKDRVVAARLLLDGGARIDVHDENGATPLHDAALGGSGKAIELLLSRKADIDSRDSEGRTPLDYALKMDRVEAARALRTAHNP